MKHLRVDPDEILFKGIVGTGGIGSGKFFRLNGDHTLGREESRSGHFLDVRDYCKQHIILHYIKVLLGPDFDTIPVGMVGEDEIGDKLIQEMTNTGFNMDFVEKAAGISTLFSFCFHYPDGSGGNLTTDNSASTHVNAAYIQKAEGKIQKLGSKGIVMAVPEVPMTARNHLLDLGVKYGSFCAASFTSEEIEAAFSEGIINHLNLLAINLDEAAVLTGKSVAKYLPADIAAAAIERVKEKSTTKNVYISITAGINGSWCWDGIKTHHCSSIKGAVRSTAGAGDAFFSGLLTGLATGHSLAEAQTLATLIAGLSVTSPHTIDSRIDRQSLYQYMNDTGFECPKSILKILEP